MWRINWPRAAFCFGDLVGWLFQEVVCSSERTIKWNVTILNTFAASYLNTQGLNNSCLKSRQRRP